MPTLVAFDLETTGLSSKTDAIIDILYLPLSIFQPLFSLQLTLPQKTIIIALIRKESSYEPRNDLS